MFWLRIKKIIFLFILLTKGQLDRNIQLQLIQSICYMYKGCFPSKKLNIYQGGVKICQQFYFYVKKNIKMINDYFKINAKSLNSYLYPF